MSRIYRSLLSTRVSHHPDAVLRYCLEEDPDAPEITGAIEIELCQKALSDLEKDLCGSDTLL